VAALGGNGLETLEAVCAGLLAPQRGTVSLSGWSAPAADSRVRKKRDAGGKAMAYIPSDREGAGLCLLASVGDNISAGRLPGLPVLDLLRGIEPRRAAGALMEGFSVKAPAQSETRSLSGGNRQRLVAARELDAFFPFVLAANPVQGLDAAARQNILSRLLALRDQGAAILILSADADDFLNVATRSYVLYRGSLRKIAEGETTAIGQNPVLASLLTGGNR